VKWSKEAEAAVSRVPFFVRKRVKKKVEEEAASQGSAVVTLDHVTSCRNRFMKDMDSEVKGFQIETCFGSGGCPNSVAPTADLVAQLEKLLHEQDLKTFLKERVRGPLKLHHEFRVTVSDCPNACSRPQIVDVGIIGAREACFSDEPCSRCESCVAACAEQGLSLSDDADRPVLDTARCVKCGACIKTCPTGSLIAGREGFRVLVGGKLGRHPQLGTELPGIYSAKEVPRLVARLLDHYKKHNEKGERFGEILNRTGLGFLG
jgi:anaerobic sulfite reductase subunit C